MEPSSQSDIVVGVEGDDRLSLSDEIPPWSVIEDYQENQDEENNKNGR